MITRAGIVVVTSMLLGCDTKNNAGLVEFAREKIRQDEYKVAVGLFDTLQTACDHYEIDILFKDPTQGEFTCFTNNQLKMDFTLPYAYRKAFRGMGVIEVVRGESITFYSGKRNRNSQDMLLTYCFQGVQADTVRLSRQGYEIVSKGVPQTDRWAYVLDQHWMARLEENK